MHHQPEHPADSAGIRYDQLTDWLTAEQACQILNCSPRWLRERIADGRWIIQKGERTRLSPEGYNTEPARPCFNADDVERVRHTLEKKAATKAVVFSSADGVGPRQPATVPLAVPPAADLVSLAIDIVRRLPAAADRGPWLTIKAAAEEYGIPPATLRQVVVVRGLASDPDVYCTSSGQLRIRRAAVASIDAHELELADASRPRRKAPRRKAAAA